MLLELTDKNKKSFDSKEHKFSDVKLADAIQLLTNYKYKDKDILWKSGIEDYWEHIIEVYKFKLDFDEQQFAQDFGFVNGASNKQKLSGYIEINVLKDRYDIELICPSIRILKNYEQFFNTVVYARYKNDIIPMWGSKAMCLGSTRILKHYKSVNGLANGIDDMLNIAYTLIQEGLDWSNSEPVKSQLDYEYSEKIKIFKLREEKDKLQDKIDEIDIKFKKYRDKCMDSFKRVITSLGDFV